jgi:phosphoglycerate dehydrogenase-like enzyme
MDERPHVEMKPTKVVVLTQLADSNPAKRRLMKMDFEGELIVEYCRQTSAEAIRAALDGASGCLCRVNDHVELTPYHLEIANRPFVVGTFSSGTDHLAGIKSLKNVRIVKSDGGNARGVAENTIWYALTLLEQAYTGAAMMEKGIMEGPVGKLVEGKQWLLVGAGEQVKRVLLKAATMGLDAFIVYHPDMTAEKLGNCLEYFPKGLIESQADMFLVRSSRDTVTTITGTRTLETGIPKADIISFHVPAKPAEPHRPGTVGMVNAEFLSLTKSSSYLINVARGSIVDETAVRDWLHQHPDRGFGSDVLDQRAELARDPCLSQLHREYMSNALVREPQNRLNLVLRPHTAGSMIEDFYRVCLEVLAKFLAALDLSWRT